MRDAKNLPRHELIGLEVRVMESENEVEEGIQGKVIDEGKGVLKVEHEDDEKTLAKKGRVFNFKLPSNEEVKVEGDVLEGRPEERIKKKLRKW
ncbi:MAG: ribonuclease P protein component 1 [Candidatus Aenigmatarchaeota archaeon]